MHSTLPITKPKSLILVALLIVCFLFLFTTNSYANSNQKLWASDSQVYIRIRNLYRLSNLATPSSAGPWTTNELIHMTNFAWKNFPNNSESRERLYLEITKELSEFPRFPITTELSLDYSIDYSFESYFHTNSNDFTENDDWVYNWSRRSPILGIPLDFTALDLFSGYLDFTIMFRLNDSLTAPVGLYSSAFRTNHSLTDFFQLDLNWPYRAVGAIGDDHWSFHFGRDKLSWGPGHTGNLMISPHMPYHEHLLFKSYFDTFSFITTCIFFPPPKRPIQQAVQI